MLHDEPGLPGAGLARGGLSKHHDTGIEHQNLFRDIFHGIFFSKLPAVLRKTSQHFLILQKAYDRFGPVIRALRHLVTITAILNDVINLTCAHSNHRAASCHGLQENHALCFRRGSEHEKV